MARIVFAFFGFLIFSVSILVSPFRADAVRYLPMHSASSRTSYSRESASERTAAKALYPTRPVCLFAFSGLPPECCRQPFVREVIGGVAPGRSCCQMGMPVAKGLEWDHRLSVHNGSPVRSNSAHGNPSGGKTVEREGCRQHRHAIVDGAAGVVHGIAAAGSLVQAHTSPCRSGSRTHSDQIEDQRATRRANESIPNRHHRVKTTPE